MSEIQLKAWCIEEAQKHSVGKSTIHEYIARGCYPAIRIRYENRRVAFVSLPAPERVTPSTNPHGYVRFSTWAEREAARLNVAVGTIYRHVAEGKYPELQILRKRYMRFVKT